MKSDLDRFRAELTQRERLRDAAAAAAPQRETFDPEAVRALLGYIQLFARPTQTLLRLAKRVRDSERK